MNVNKWMVGMIFLSIPLLILGFFGCCHNQRSSTDSLEKIKQMFEKEIPPGTTADQVEKFLTQKNIEHGFYEKENLFYAKIHDTKESSFPFSVDIKIIIGLDDNKRVKEVEVQKIRTGP